MTDTFRVLDDEHVKPRQLVGGFTVGVHFLGAFAESGRVGVNRSVAQVHGTGRQPVNFRDHAFRFVGLARGLRGQGVQHDIRRHVAGYA